MSKSIIKDRSYDFSLKIIRLYDKLKSSREYELGRQVLRSGTSVGANIVEAHVLNRLKNLSLNSQQLIKNR